MCKLEHPVYGQPEAAGIDVPEQLKGLIPETPLGPRPVEMQPTKFAKLLKVAIPLAIGGGLGATANPRVGGAGEAAAENFFARENALALHRQALERQIVNDYYRNALEAARTQHELLAGGPGTGRTWKAVSPEDNKTHVYTLGARGEAVDRGVAPAEPTELSAVPTSTGIYSFERRGPEPGKTTPLVSGGEQPEAPLAVGQPGIPLQPPERFERPIPVTNRTPEGEETTTFYDPRKVPLGKPIGRRAPRPGKTPNQAKVETYAEEALKATGDDADKALQIVDNLRTMPAEMKAAVRNRIREMKRPGQSHRRMFSPEELKKMAQGVPQSP